MNSPYAPDPSAPKTGYKGKNNAAEKTPCILLIDCSASMVANGRMAQVNEGLRSFEAIMQADKIMAQHVIMSVIAVGVDRDKVELVTDWTDAEDFVAPQLSAAGTTPMGTAIDFALDQIEEVTWVLKSEGFLYKRPWIFLLTDGDQFDPGWEPAAARCVQAIKDKKCILWALVTTPGDPQLLYHFVGPDGNVFQIDNTSLKEMFVWLSSSLAGGDESPPYPGTIAPRG